MKIKIISYNIDYCDDIEHFALQGITDWDEVDEDTYRKLDGWCKLKNRESYDRYCVVRQCNLDLPTCVTEYVAHVEKEEQRRAEQKRKREEARKLRAAKKQQLKEADEVRLLQDLMKKHKDKI